MKKLNLNNVTDVFIESVNKTHLELLNAMKEIKNEYTINMIDEKIKLLVLIAEGEGLDFNILKNKYLKPKELMQFTQIIQPKVQIEDNNIMDKIEFNGKQYYCESKEKSIVYDMNSKPVGYYKNGTIVFD